MTLSLRGAITGVGSLPGVEAEEAIDFIAACAPELPFWPQLPQRGPEASMIGQSLMGLTGLLSASSTGVYHITEDRAGFLTALDQAEVGYDERRAPGFFAFLRALENDRFPRARLIKAQVDGPLTLCAQLRIDDVAPVRDGDFLRGAARRCAALARWQIKRLKERFERVLCVVDEPCLGFLPPGPEGEDGRAAVSLVLAAIQNAGALSGLHCCGLWPTGFQPAIAAASFDEALSYRIWEGSEHGRRWRLEGSGLLILGAVPTSRGERALWRAEALAERPELLKGLDRLALSASCGLGTLSWAEARDVFDRAEEARRALLALS